MSWVTIPTKLTPSPEKKGAVIIPAEFNSLTVVTPRVVMPGLTESCVTEAIPPITFTAVSVPELPVILIS